MISKFDHSNMAKLFLPYLKSEKKNTRTKEQRGIGEKRRRN